MKVTHLDIDNFMIFDSLKIDWSSNVNIISGENSTGKTTILKLIYSSLKPICKKRF